MDTFREEWVSISVGIQLHIISLVQPGSSLNSCFLTKGSLGRQTFKLILTLQHHFLESQNDAMPTSA